jgi:hypothetical protein
MNAGTTIVRSFQLVEEVWMQVQALADSLGALTELALNDGVFKDLQGAGASKTFYRKSDSGWSYMDYAVSIPVMEKKRRKPLPGAWINYQISVFGSGIPPLQAGGQETVGPVLHVSFWGLKTDFNDPGVFVEFPAEWDDWDIKDDRLLSWPAEEPGGFDQWTFSVRLLDLRDEDALRQAVIDPIKKLLGGAEAAVALPSDLPGLVFYANEGDDAAGWTLAARGMTREA